MLTSDEANFELHGCVKSQNVRRYAPLKSSDPVEGGRPEHFVVDKPTYSPKLMVFCGMRRDGTFGLTIFRNHRMNGASYHRLLQYTVFPELRQWNGGNMDGLYWQQDGAPVHCTDANMRYLDNQFGDRIIGRRCIQGREWPPRSPDLSPLDFCLWGFLKSKVYNPRPGTLNALEANIRREVAALDPEMINRAILGMKTRAQRCIANNGGHVEA